MNDKSISRAHLFSAVTKFSVFAWISCFFALVLSVFPWNRPESALIDDAYIVLRYARNFANGFGLTYNPGEYVAGFTSTLHTFILSIPYFLDKNYLAFLQYFGAFSLIFLGISTFWLAMKHKLGVVAAALSVFVSLHWAPVFFAGAGLETVFYAASLAIGVAAYLHGRLTLASFLLGLAVLNRHEALLIWGVLIVHDFLVCGDFKRIVRLAAPFLVTLAALTIFLWSIYGDPFPLAFYNKVSLSKFALERGWNTFWDQSGYAHVRWCALAAMGTTALAGIFYITRLVSLINGPDEKPAKGWQWLLQPSSLLLDVFLLASCVTVYIVYQIIVGGDWMGARFLTHWLALVCAFGVYGIALIIRAAAGVISAERVRSAIYGFLTGAACLGLLFFVKLPDPELKPLPKMAGLIDASRWLKEHASKDHTLATCWAGVPAYFSELYAIDTWGRTNKEIGKKRIRVRSAEQLGVPGHEKQDNFWVASQKPDYVMCSVGADGHISGVAAPLDLVPFRNIFSYREWYNEALGFVDPNGKFEIVDYGESSPLAIWDDIRHKFSFKILRDARNPAGLNTDGQALSARRKAPRKEVLLNRFDFRDFRDDGPIRSSTDGVLLTQPWFFEKGHYRLRYSLSGTQNAHGTLQISGPKEIGKFDEASISSSGDFQFEITSELKGTPVTITIKYDRPFIVQEMALMRVP